MWTQIHIKVLQALLVGLEIRLKTGPNSVYVVIQVVLGYCAAKDVAQFSLTESLLKALPSS